MFLRSSSVKVHLLRGVVGLGFLTLVVVYQHAWGWWTLVPAVGALVALGGCPMCWIVGLVNTAMGGESVSLCLDGTCPGAGQTAPKAKEPSLRS